ncbi:MAG: arginine deiminase family protein, partial [Bacillota bacterium]
VLLRRPGREIEALTDPAEARWIDLMDADLARRQHDELAEIYRRHGVEVHYIEEMAPDRPNALFVRDQVAMTPEGAIVARPALDSRRGEERYAAEALARLGVPIIRTISGGGTFEGADLMWVDPTTVIIGVGNRTNREGAAQVEEVLRRMGVQTFLYFQVPYGQAHIDGLFNLAGPDVCVFFPWQTPFEVADVLRRRGYRMIEITSPREAKTTMASNFVCLEPGRIVMPAGSVRTQEKLEGAGLEVIAADVSELQKGWGGIHCMTAFLHRDRV